MLPFRVGAKESHPSPVQVLIGHLKPQHTGIKIPLLHNVLGINAHVSQPFNPGHNTSLTTGAPRQFKIGNYTPRRNRPAPQPFYPAQQIILSLSKDGLPPPQPPTAKNALPLAIYLYG